MHSMLPWKEEPVSPLSSEEASLLDETFYQSAIDDFKFENDLFDECENKAEVASQILENLENLVDLDELIKVEPSFLLDDKMLPPLLDDVEPPRAVPVPYKTEQYPQSSTYLFKEFEKVYHELNQASGALTPPQSPPTDEQPVMATLEPILGGPSIHYVPEKLAFPSIIQEIDPGLAVVDEIVRNTVEDMQWNCGPSSPESSSNSSGFGDSSDDPEYVPEAIENYNDTSFGPERIQQVKKRSKPYSVDDKKSRKKEQNKNAATRYRLKKKAEVEVILNEEKVLMDKQEALNKEMGDLQREIKCLKGLMRDFFRAKGMIN